MVLDFEKIPNHKIILFLILSLDIVHFNVIIIKEKYYFIQKHFFNNVYFILQ